MSNTPSYKCAKCGNMEIKDGLLVMELGRCQQAFNDQYEKYKKCLAFIKNIATSESPDFNTPQEQFFIEEASGLLKEIGEL